ncbi:hypothetical protein [Paludisphaera sp.]|uniref:hypothetical protein n=1 Tax=Paludisphaera sp. TaxID=2017432 RepID=UPI00301CCBCA
MFVDKYERVVEVAEPIGVDEMAIDRARDIHMLTMARRKVPYRLIARYFGCSVGTVHNRLKGMPAEARERYASLGGLDSL